MNLADGLRDLLDVKAGVPGEPGLLVGHHQRQQGRHGDTPRDLRQPQHEEGDPAAPHKFDLKGELEEAEGWDPLGPVHRLEEQPRGRLADKVYGGG